MHSLNLIALGSSITSTTLDSDLTYELRCSGIPAKQVIPTPDSTSRLCIRYDIYTQFGTVSRYMGFRLMTCLCRIPRPGGL